jgi:hypothetical protein
MTEQIETYLREQFAADAEQAPLARDLAGAARSQVRRQRRRTGAALAVGMGVLVLLAGVTYGLAGPSRTVAPPAQDGTSSAAPTASPPSDEPDLPRLISSWLEQPQHYRATDMGATPFGGRVYCATTIVDSNGTGSVLYAWALCHEVYVKDGKVALGAGASGPLWVSVHRSGSTTRIINAEAPRQQHLDADYRRLFPPRVRALMYQAPSNGIATRLSDEDLLTRARADLESGRGLTVPIDGVAARFLAFARGTAEGIPADAPVKLYLGNRYEKTIAGAALSDRQEWEVCTPEAQGSCRPVSALSALRDLKQTPAMTADLPTTCLVTLGDEPTDTGGDSVGALTHPDPTTCADQFAVQIWANDAGQITAVNLLLGRP